MAISVGGVAFAVFIIFIEVGFLNGIYDTQTDLVRRLNGDLFVINRLKEDLLPTQPFPRARLEQARAAEGVVDAWPVHMNEFTGMWKNPADGRSHVILVMAFDPAHPVFRVPEITAHQEALALPDTAMFDAASRPLYGAATPTAELAGRRLRLVGTFELGPSFRNDGLLVMSDTNFRRFFPDPEEQVEIGLLRVAPGRDLAEVQRQLRRDLPGDVVVLTRDELMARIRLFWSIYQPIGLIFGIGALIGFVIGITICYQLLFNDISDNLPQLATLMAMGHTPDYLRGLVVIKALFLAALGFVPGMLLSLTLYVSLETWTGIRMWLTFPRAAVVLALSVGMCAIAGLLAARRAIRLDPAELY